MVMNTNSLLTGPQWGLVIVFFLLCAISFLIEVYRRGKHYYKYEGLFGFSFALFFALSLGSFLYFMNYNSEERIENYAKNAIVEDQKFSDYTKMKTALCLLNKTNVYFENDKNLQVIDSISADTTLVFCNKTVHSFRDIRFINN